MNKKVTVGLMVSLCAIVCAITFTLTMFISTGLFDSKMSSTKAREAMYTKIAELDSYIRDSYVGELNDEELMNGLLKGYISGVGDTYANFYTAGEWEQVQSEFDGVVNGIGVQCKVDTTGYLRVVRVYADSPALEKDIEVGDLIIAVDDSDVLSIGAKKANEMIVGDPGTQVSITYMRDGATKTEELVRRAVSVPSISYEYIEDSSVGYIRIYEFNSNSAAQFESALDQLNEKGATSLVLDLRDNTGGLTDACAKMLDMLVGECDDMIKAKYKDETKVLYDSDENCVKIPIVLVVNENTASSAELFCSVLKCENEAKVVGNTTYGKGVMQEYKQLSDGSGVDISVAYLLNSKDESFDKDGITPDYEIKYNTSQAQNSYNYTATNDPILKKAYEVAQTDAKKQENHSNALYKDEEEQEETITEDTQAEQESNTAAVAWEIGIYNM